MTYPTDEAITPRRWLWTPRTKPLRMIEIHATRGNAAPEVQYPATKNWMQSDNNTNKDRNGVPLYQWGGSCSFILGRDGKTCKVLEDNQMPTYSAGYGSLNGGYAIDEYAVSVEWCQSANQEEFTTAQYEEGANISAHYCQAFNISPEIVTILSQTGTPPSGHVRHDGCENGVKLGKTDPGPKFRNTDFVTLVKEKLTPIEEDDMNAEQDARLKRIEAHLLKIRGPEDNMIMAQHFNAQAAALELAAKSLRAAALEQVALAPTPPV